MSTTKECAIRDCGRPVKARGLCMTHYMRQYRGRPLSGQVRHYGPRAETLARRRIAREAASRARAIGRVATAIHAAVAAGAIGSGEAEA